MKCYGIKSLSLGFGLLVALCGMVPSAFGSISITVGNANSVAATTTAPSTATNASPSWTIASLATPADVGVSPVQGYWQKLLPASLITASNPVKHDLTLTEYIHYTGPSAIGTWTENVKVSPYGPNQLWFFNDTAPLSAYYSVNGSATQITAGITKTPGQVLFDFGPSGLPIGTVIKLVTTLDYYNYVTPSNKFTGSVEVDETATAIPEPASLIVWGLLGAGWVGASVVRGRRSNVGGTKNARAWSNEQRDAIRNIVLGSQSRAN